MRLYILNGNLPHLAGVVRLGPRARAAGSRAVAFRMKGMKLARAAGLAGIAPWNGPVWDSLVQRGTVTLALAAEAVLAAGLLRYRGASAGPLTAAHLAANEANPATSDSSTNSPRTGTAAPSSSSSGAKCRSTAI